MVEKLQVWINQERELVITGLVSFLVSLFSLIFSVQGEFVFEKIVYLLGQAILYSTSALIAYSLLHIKDIQKVTNPSVFVIRIALFILVAACFGAFFRFSLINFLDLGRVDIFKIFYKKSSTFEMFQLWTIPTAMIIAIFFIIQRIAKLESSLHANVFNSVTQQEEEVVFERKIKITGRNRHEELYCTFSELVSIQSFGHYAILSVLRDGDIREVKFRNSISDLFIQLKIQDGQKQFMRVNRSVLVNLDFVEDICEEKNELAIKHRMDKIGLTDVKKRKLLERLTQRNENMKK